MWQNKVSFQEQRRLNKINNLHYIILFISIILVIRVFNISIVRGSYFHSISEGNRIQIFPETAPRGIIYDRRGKVLAASRLSFSVLFSPINLGRDTARESMLKISKVLGTGIKSRRGVTGSLCLAEDVEPEKIFYLSEQKHNLPGMRIQEHPRRRYPYNDFASHLLGHLGEISRKDLSKPGYTGYRMGDITGRAGLERLHDRLLRGIDGSEQIEVDARGRPLRILRHQESRMGKQLVLTLDKSIQEVCENALAGRKGAVCVLDPRNGEVLAMVSKPGYDPNIFVGHTTTEKYSELFNNPDLPMFNRAIQSQQAPGSVFKIITTVAALETEAMDTEMTFKCRGSFFLGRGGGRREFKCWEKHGHGEVNLVEAIACSCDVFFYRTGLKTGPENIAKYAFMFGLNDSSGFCLPGEEKGLIPTMKWKRNALRDYWYPGDTVNMSIGQGYVLVTPMQMANMISLVATRGTLYRPFVVKRVLDTEGRILKTFEPEIQKRISLKKNTWDVLQEGLMEAVQTGTCRAIKFRDLVAAAKTGTAQNPHGEDHAWFVCYAPVDNPQVAIAVYVEHGGHGSSGAAPIARKVLEKMFNLREERIVEIFIAGD